MIRTTMDSSKLNKFNNYLMGKLEFLEIFINQ